MARRTAPPSPPGPDDDDLAALYRAPLGEFVDARNTLAARLRKAGDAEAAAHVKALPKPGAPSWALNQVYWQARPDYDRLIAAGDRLRSLQQQMLGGRTGDPRESMQERQAAVRRVVERAARFLADAGQPPTDATRQRIAVTADALATWGSQPQGYVPGRLDRDIDPPGFAALASLGVSALRLVKPAKSGSDGPATRPAPVASPPATLTGAPPRRPTVVPPGKPVAVESPAEKRAAAQAAQQAARARESERRRRAAALQQAERDLRQRASVRERAEAARSRTAAEADSIRKQLDALEQQLAALQRQLAAMRTRLERAERTHAEADEAAADAGRAHAEAEETASRARRDLEHLEK